MLYLPSSSSSWHLPCSVYAISSLFLFLLASPLFSLCYIFPLPLPPGISLVQSMLSSLFLFLLASPLFSLCYIFSLPLPPASPLFSLCYIFPLPPGISLVQSMLYLPSSSSSWHLPCSVYAISSLFLFLLASLLFSLCYIFPLPPGIFLVQSMLYLPSSSSSCISLVQSMLYLPSSSSSWHLSCSVYAISSLFLLASSLFSLCYIFPLPLPPASPLFSLCYIFPLPPGISLVQSMLYLPSSSSSWHIPCSVYAISSLFLFLLHLPSSVYAISSLFLFLLHLPCSIYAISFLFLLASSLFSLCYIFPLPPGIFLVQSMLYLPSSSSSWHLPCSVYAISSLFLFLLASSLFSLCYIFRLPLPPGISLVQSMLYLPSSSSSWHLPCSVYAIPSLFLFLLASPLFSLCYIFPLPLPPGISLVQSMLSSLFLFLLHLPCSVYAISSLFLFLLASSLFSLCYIFPLLLPPGISLVQSMLYLPSSSSSWHLPCSVYAISSLFLFLLASPLFSLCYIFPLPLPPGISLVQSMLYRPSSSSSWHLPCSVYAISSLFLFLLASSLFSLCYIVPLPLPPGISLVQTMLYLPSSSSSWHLPCSVCGHVVFNLPFFVVLSSLRLLCPTSSPVPLPQPPSLPFSRLLPFISFLLPLLSHTHTPSLSPSLSQYPPVFMKLVKRTILCDPVRRPTLQQILTVFKRDPKILSLMTGNRLPVNKGRRGTLPATISKGVTQVQKHVTQG